MTPFTARVRQEGAKSSLCITVPAPITKQLHEAGFRPPGWVRLKVQGYAPVFVVARRPPSRPSVSVTLPVWAFDGLASGTPVSATVEDATPYRARERDGHDFDWLPYVDRETYLPVDDGPHLQLHSRYEQPFTLRRHPNPEVVEKLCKRGVPSNRDYATTDKNVDNLKTVIELGLGITGARIQIEGSYLRVMRSQPLVRLLQAWRTKENTRASN